MGGRGSASAKSTGSQGYGASAGIGNTNTGGHLGNMSDGTIDSYYKKLGVSNPEAARKAVYAYTGSLYTAIREGDHPELTNLCDEVIHKCPKYDGYVHRGMSVSEDYASSLQPGGTVSMGDKGPSSWSSNKMVARDFASDTSDSRPVEVVFTMKNKRGATIQHNSKFKNEDEVLHKSGEEYKIDSVVRTGNKVQVILMDE